MYNDKEGAALLDKRVDLDDKNKTTRIVVSKYLCYAPPSVSYVRSNNVLNKNPGNVYQKDAGFK